MPKRAWWKCRRCGWEGDGADGYGTHGCNPAVITKTFTTYGVPYYVPDLIDPETYWRKLGEEIATWKKIEEDDSPDVPTFL